MTLKTRFQIIVKTTGLMKMLLIALIYGFVFGGMMSLFEKNMNIWDAIKSTLNITVAYGFMFLLIIVIVYVTTVIKMYISINMTRQEVIKMWSGFVLVNVVLTGVFTYCVVLYNLLKPKEFLNPRVFNMDINHINVLTALEIFGLLLLVIVSIYIYSSLISAFGNIYGAINAISVLLLTITVGVKLFPALIGVVVWGTHLLSLVIFLVLFNILGYIACRKLITMTEVAR